MKVKVWDKVKYTETEEKDVSPQQVSSVERYKIREMSGAHVDGCQIILKNQDGTPGQQILTKHDYHELCRGLQITPEGKTGTDAKSKGSEVMDSLAVSALGS